jgi:hypothetical protein
MAQVNVAPAAMAQGKKRIAVMTSGGDSQGMSGAVLSSVKQLPRAATHSPFTKATKVSSRVET